MELRVKSTARERFNLKVVCLVVRSSCVVALLGLAGCSGETAPTAAVDPAEAAARAIELCDANKDGALSLDECVTAPGLQSAFTAYDVDGSGTLTATELEQGIGEWSKRPEPIPVEVRLASGVQPVSNAIVTLQPVPFLADRLPEAEGKTDRSGFTRMHAYDVEFPESMKREYFMFPGLYNVKVTVPNQAKEFPVLGAAITQPAIASRAIRIDVARNGTAKILPNQ